MDAIRYEVRNKDAYFEKGVMKINSNISNWKYEMIKAMIIYLLS